MRRVLIPVAMLATVGAVVAAYAVTSRVSTDRPDCPGKIVCPLTGKTVCRDRCPLNVEQRDTPSGSPWRGGSAGVENPNAKRAVKEGCCP